jgi:hypothetical protein
MGLAYYQGVLHLFFFQPASLSLGEAGFFIGAAENTDCGERSI